jgi:hypothetical protein
MNDPLGEPGSTPLYTCFPPVWGAAGGDYLNPQHSWTKMDTRLNKTTSPRELKKKRDSHTGRSLQGTPQQGAESSGIPSRWPVAISEPAVSASDKGRDEPQVRNLPEVRPGTSLMGVSYADIPLQGAGTASLPAVGGEPGHLITGVGGSCSARKALSECARRKLK